MIRRNTIEIDNRDASQMYEYLEARIEVLKRRVEELENENSALHQSHTRGHHRSNVSEYVNHSHEASEALTRKAG